MKRHLFIIALAAAQCALAAPAPFPVRVNSLDRQAPGLTVFRANEHVFRVRFVDGTTASDVSTLTPYMHWATASTATGLSTSSWAFVSDGVDGLVDFTFAPESINYEAGQYGYEVGVRDGANDPPRTYSQGAFAIRASPVGAGVDPVTWTTPADWDLIDWTNLPAFLESVAVDATLTGDGTAGDPLVVAAAIVAGAASGATAEGWGDHALAGYLTAEADATALAAIAALTPASIGAATAAQGANADTAHDLTTGVQPLDTATVIDRSVMVATGFDLAGANQTYIQDGTYQGKPYYVGVTDPSWRILWNAAGGEWDIAAQWILTDVELGQPWQYRSFDDVATPDLASWELGPPAGGETSGTVTAGADALADVAARSTDYAAQFQSVGVFDAATGRASLGLGTAATTDATAYASTNHVTTAATASVLGHVKIGTGVDVAADGTISVTIPGTPDLQAVTDVGGSTTNDLTLASGAAMTIGSRQSGKAVGARSFALGSSIEASGSDSIATGSSSAATAAQSQAHGVFAKAEHGLSYVWQGQNLEAAWSSKGAGTWAINPEGGTAGAYIGDDSIAELFLLAAAETDTKLGALEAELAAGRRIYYCVQSPTFTNTLSQVYGTLSTTPDADTYTVEIGPIDTTEFAQYSPGRGRITEAGLDVLSIPAGIFAQSLYFDNSQGSNRAVALRVTATMVDADGESNPTVIATSSTGTIEALGAGVVQRIDLAFAVATDFDTGGLDRRMLLDYEFKRSGSTGGTDPVVTRYAGGSSSGALSLQVPSTVIMLTSAANATSDALANLGGFDASATPFAITPVAGTSTVSRANSAWQSLTLDAATVLVVEDGATATIDSIRLELIASTHAITLSTNNVAWASFSVSTNGTTSVLLDSQFGETTWRGYALEAP